MLKCPKCDEALHRYDKVLKCKNNHCFDIAKQGYINLFLKNKKDSGDDAEMIKSRKKFLEKGYYEPLRNLLCSIIKEIDNNVLVDAGCGEGYYTSAFSNVASCTYGFDLSKSALKLASANDKQTQYLLASIAHLPIDNQSVDVLTNVFAPFNEKEYCRVLKHDGWIIKVEPGPYHLYELKQVLYETVYLNEADAFEYENLVLEKEELLNYEIEVLSQQDIQALFQMTPYYWKSPKKGSDALRKLDSLKTQVSFHIECYRKQVK